MANISVTYTFSNGSTADATEVNTNFTDIINGTSDGTKDFSINALTCAGAATLNGDVTLGNATSDDVTITGRIASDIDPKTAASNTLGDATQTWQALYLDNTATDGGTIYFDGGSTEYIQSIADGSDLLIGGFTGLDLQGAEIKTFGLHDSAKVADYTVTDTDGVSVVLMTTSTTDRTVTLPTAADNAGRVLTVKKVDSGSGTCTLDGEGAETIDGDTTQVLSKQYEFITVQCDGTSWHTITGGIADDTQAGLLPPPANMQDVLATLLGYKPYYHGTSYSGGNAPTVTLSSGGGSLSSVNLAQFCPYQLQDSTWRMRFNIEVVLSSATRTIAILAINGVTFYNTGGDGQAISAGMGAALDKERSVATSNSNTVTCGHDSGSTTTYYYSGDVALASKPTWAY